MQFAEAVVQDVCAFIDPSDDSTSMAESSHRRAMLLRLIGRYDITYKAE